MAKKQVNKVASSPTKPTPAQSSSNSTKTSPRKSTAKQEPKTTSTKATGLATGTAKKPATKKVAAKTAEIKAAENKAAASKKTTTTKTAAKNGAAQNGAVKKGAVKKGAAENTAATKTATTKTAGKSTAGKKPAVKKVNANAGTQKRAAAKKVASTSRTPCDDPVGCPRGAIRPKFLNTVPEESRSIEIERRERWSELLPDYEQGLELVRKFGPKLMKHPEVTGVHVGFKRIRNCIVRPLQYCIRLSVRRKRPTNDHRIVDPLPKSINGYPVDVFERTYETIADSMSTTLPHTSLSHSPSNTLATKPHKRKRSKSKLQLPHNNTIIEPLRGGVVIADIDTPENWGTLGLIGKGQSGKKYAITCAHVASKRRNRKATVTQPAALDATTPTRVIGQVAYSARNTSIDAAVIELVDGIKSRRQAVIAGSNNYLAGAIGFGAAIPESRAFKIGAASDPNAIVHGRIQLTTGIVDIKGFGTMTDQIVVINDNGNDFELIRPGDSGSVLLMMTSAPDVFLVVGLVHARTSDGAIVACPWNKILEHFPLVEF
jgi:hypothetical protein